MNATLHVRMPMNNEVLAIILGGGQGSRLFPLTQLRSKPAVPIGGQVSVITKSSANQLHGSVFEYLRHLAELAADGRGGHHAGGQHGSARTGLHVGGGRHIWEVDLDGRDDGWTRHEPAGAVRAAAELLVSIRGNQSAGPRARRPRFSACPALAPR